MGKKKELGYKGEISPVLILRPTENAIRNLFIWFNEHVRTTKEVDTQKGEQVLINSIINELQSLNSEFWLPPLFQNPRRHYQVTDVFNAVPLETGYLAPHNNFKPQQSYVREFLPLVTLQPESKNWVAPSLIEANTSKVVEEQEREEILNAQLSQGMNPAVKKTTNFTLAKN